MNFLSISDWAALFGIMGGVVSVVLWLGSKIFVSRAELHQLKNDLTGIRINLELNTRDIQWLRKPKNGGRS